jgi:hypothetical protein
MTQTATGTIPFLLIFSVGYLYVGLLTLRTRWLANRAARAEVIAEVKSDAKALAA